MISYPQTKVAVIGDYGKAGDDLQKVSELIHSWDPELVLTTGDNNYNNGEFSTIDLNIGQYFHHYIYPYYGSFGNGSKDSVNRFFPILGNHDWRTANAQPYRDYFTLPGNERYYDFVYDDIHFIMLDSDAREPDGITTTSIQKVWYDSVLNSSNAKWKIVILHHAPYSSGLHGSNHLLRWNFYEDSVDVVISGHDHHYERLNVKGKFYFVNGVGGRSLYPLFSPLPESQFRYNDDYGAMLISVDENRMIFEFFDWQNNKIDSSVVIKSIENNKILSITAYFVDESVVMKWIVENEDDGVAYAIERSSSQSNWETIGIIDGNGSTNFQNEYEFTDFNFPQSFRLFYRLKKVFPDGSFEYSYKVQADVKIINKISLSQNYPNPFNSSTRINFTLPYGSFVKLELYNILGELVKIVANGFFSTGDHSVLVTTDDLINGNHTISSGIYFYKLSTENNTLIKKMILLR